MYFEAFLGDALLFAAIIAVWPALASALCASADWHVQRKLRMSEALRLTAPPITATAVALLVVGWSTLHFGWDPLTRNLALAGCIPLVLGLQSVLLARAMEIRAGRGVQMALLTDFVALALLSAGTMVLMLILSTIGMVFVALAFGSMVLRFVFGG